MSAGGHTAGPWRVHTTDSVGGWNILAASLSKDAYFACLAVAIQRDAHSERGGGISWDEAKANAHLIAAAPALLDVVQRVHALEQSTTGKGLLDLSTTELLELYKAARAALAQATGRQP